MVEEQAPAPVPTESQERQHPMAPLVLQQQQQRRQDSARKRDDGCEYLQQEFRVMMLERQGTLQKEMLEDIEAQKQQLLALEEEQLREQRQQQQRLQQQQQLEEQQKQQQLQQQKQQAFEEQQELQLQQLQLLQEQDIQRLQQQVEEQRRLQEQRLQQWHSDERRRQELMQQEQLQEQEREHERQRQVFEAQRRQVEVKKQSMLQEFKQVVEQQQQVMEDSRAALERQQKRREEDEAERDRQAQARQKVYLEQQEKLERQRLAEVHWQQPEERQRPGGEPRASTPGAQQAGEAEAAESEASVPEGAEPDETAADDDGEMPATGTDEKFPSFRRDGLPRCLLVARKGDVYLHVGRQEEFVAAIARVLTLRREVVASQARAPTPVVIRRQQWQVMRCEAQEMVLGRVMSEWMEDDGAQYCKPPSQDQQPAPRASTPVSGAMGAMSEAQLRRRTLGYFKTHCFCNYGGQHWLKFLIALGEVPNEAVAATNEVVDERIQERRGETSREEPARRADIEAHWSRRDARPCFDAGPELPKANGKTLRHEAKQQQRKLDAERSRAIWPSLDEEREFVARQAKIKEFVDEAERVSKAGYRSYVCGHAGGWAQCGTGGRGR